ncbi:MAG: DUF4351 domain-containing protein [Pirellulales bacterium]|nr:DUF4351 domain-containing protein [Pirellulales bacterium]
MTSTCGSPWTIRPVGPIGLIEPGKRKAMMADPKQEKGAEQDSDYDGAWKDALRLHFRGILEKYFPAVAATIDWGVDPQWHDKELSQVLAQAGHRAGRVDLLVRVRLLTGEDQWIFLHVEVQSTRETDFEVRVARYNGGLFWIFKQRVVSLVVLADLDERWRPCEDVFRLADFETRMRFPVCKLIDQVDHHWGEDEPSLAVQVARAQIAALRTAGNPSGRYRAKWQLVRNLFELGYNADELREIFRLIDWMMRLPEDLSLKFEQELTALEESLNMPYITSVERIAEARGKAEGGAAVVLKMLASLFGSLPAGLQQRVRQMPIEGLEALAGAVPRFRSMEDIQVWLDSHEASSQ